MVRRLNSPCSLRFARDVGGLLSIGLGASTRRERALLLAAALLQVVAAGASYFAYLATGRVVGLAISRRVGDVVGYLAGALVCFVVTGAAQIASAYFGEHARLALRASLQSRLHSRYFLPCAPYRLLHPQAPRNAPFSGATLDNPEQRLTQDVDQLSLQLCDLLLGTFASPVSLVGTLTSVAIGSSVIVALVSPVAVAVCVGACAVHSAISIGLAVPVSRAYYHADAALGHLRAGLFSTIEHAEAVLWAKSQGLEGALLDSDLMVYVHRAAGLLAWQWLAAGWSGFAGSAPYLLCYLAILCVLWAEGPESLATVTAAGDGPVLPDAAVLSTAAASIAAFLSALLCLPSAWAQLVCLAGYIARVQELDDALCEVVAEGGSDDAVIQMMMNRVPAIAQQEAQSSDATQSNGSSSSSAGGAVGNSHICCSVEPGCNRDLVVDGVSVTRAAPAAAAASAVLGASASCTHSAHTKTSAAAAAAGSSSQRPLLLEGVSFRVHPGCSTLLQGVSGLGKTSLLRVLAGLCNPAPSAATQVMHRSLVRRADDAAFWRKHAVFGPQGGSPPASFRGSSADDFRPVVVFAPSRSHLPEGLCLGDMLRYPAPPQQDPPALLRNLLLVGDVAPAAAAQLMQAVGALVALELASINGPPWRAVVERGKCGLGCHAPPQLVLPFPLLARMRTLAYHSPPSDSATTAHAGSPTQLAFAACSGSGSEAPSAAFTAAADAALREVGLGHLVATLSTAAPGAPVPVTQLSHGEAQRLALARVLLLPRPPAFVFLDEALSGVDTMGLKGVYGALEIRGITPVTVGHRPELAQFHHRVVDLGRFSAVPNARGLGTLSPGALGQQSPAAASLLQLDPPLGGSPHRDGSPIDRCDGPRPNGSCSSAAPQCSSPGAECVHRHNALTVVELGSLDGGATAPTIIHTEVAPETPHAYPTPDRLPLVSNPPRSQGPARHCSGAAAFAGLLASILQVVFTAQAPVSASPGVPAPSPPLRPHPPRCCRSSGGKQAFPPLLLTSVALPWLCAAGALGLAIGLSRVTVLVAFLPGRIFDALLDNDVRGAAVAFLAALAWYLASPALGAAARSLGRLTALFWFVRTFKRGLQLYLYAPPCVVGPAVTAGGRPCKGQLGVGATADCAVVTTLTFPCPVAARLARPAAPSSAFSSHAGAARAATSLRTAARGAPTAAVVLEGGESGAEETTTVVFGALNGDGDDADSGRVPLLHAEHAIVPAGAPSLTEDEDEPPPCDDKTSNPRRPHLDRVDQRILADQQQCADAACTLLFGGEGRLSLVQVLLTVCTTAAALAQSFGPTPVLCAFLYAGMALLASHCLLHRISGAVAQMNLAEGLLRAVHTRVRFAAEPIAFWRGEPAERGIADAAFLGVLAAGLARVRAEFPVRLLNNIVAQGGSCVTFIVAMAWVGAAGTVGGLPINGTNLYALISLQSSLMLYLAALPDYLANFAEVRGWVHRAGGALTALQSAAHDAAVDAAVDAAAHANAAAAASSSGAQRAPPQPSAAAAATAAAVAAASSAADGHGAACTDAPHAPPPLTVGKADGWPAGDGDGSPCLRIPAVVLALPLRPTDPRGFTTETQQQRYTLRSLPPLLLSPGAPILIRGPSGAGKTSYLRALAGLLPRLEPRVARGCFQLMQGRPGNGGAPCDATTVDLPPSAQRGSASSSPLCALEGELEYRAFGSARCPATRVIAFVPHRARLLDGATLLQNLTLSSGCSSDDGDSGGSGSWDANEGSSGHRHTEGDPLIFGGSEGGPDRRTEAAAALGAVGLGHLLHCPAAGGHCPTLRCSLDATADWTSCLSQGEGQRLALARLLMSPRPLFALLDEATSALDPRAEGAVLRALLGAGIGVLCVSHRASTVEALGASG